MLIPLALVDPEFAVPASPIRLPSIRIVCDAAPPKDPIEVVAIAEPNDPLMILSVTSMLAVPSNA
jgi:hypothetical protein